MIPHAQLLWLDDVAHLPQLESDPTTLEEIARFVDAQRAGYRNSTTGMSHQ
jgi:pimeloyl-ACP methyl ester carboxylesterase